jgi:pSer/pThr/pTyr-binding forkhead associated (FHA) protein
MQLPSLSRTRVFPDALFTVLANTELDQGYVHARTTRPEDGAERDAFLFLRDGKTWCAGTRDADGSLGALSVAEFLRSVRGAREVTLHRTDLPLFLCAAVLFRKPPAAHVPAALVDSEALLKSVRALGKDAVLAVQRGDAWALAFCRSGEPVALYSTDATPESGTVSDRLMELIYASPNDVTIQLYDEIKLPRASDAGQELSALAAPQAQDAAKGTLVVMLGDRVVFRHRLDKPETIVGRGDDVDLALDNLSVSRRHALVRAVRDDVGDALIVADLGSENGLTQNNARCLGAVTLRPGDRVGVGKYTLIYVTHVVGGSDLANVETSAPRKRPATADIETVAVQPKSVVIEHRGTKHRVASVVFTIGSSPEAHLRIKGFLVSPVQALLQMDGDGWRLDDHGTWRKVRVNGEVTKRAPLVDGDELMIAGETMKFRYL